MVNKNTINKLQKKNAGKRRELITVNESDPKYKELEEEIKRNEIELRNLQSLKEEDILRYFWEYLGLHNPSIVFI